VEYVNAGLSGIGAKKKDGIYFSGSYIIIRD
jgi:hypothetical protein